MTGLTARQQEVLRWIQQFVRIRSRFPTYREVMTGFGYKSTNAAGDMLRALARKGYLQQDGLYWRLVAPSGRCPTCGQVLP